MLVKDIMTKEKIALISPMATVRDALKMMRKHNVKSIVVEKMHNDDAYGLITYKNILHSIVAEDGDIDLLNVYDICSKPAVQVSGELGVKYAARMMVNQSIKRLLVIDHNELRGILTMSDILQVILDSADSM